jgi:hypothetical protein
MEEHSADESPPTLGVAALLKTCSMTYTDCQNVIRIYRGKRQGVRGPTCIAAIPKDGYSDGYRFREALQEKVLRFGGNLPLVEVSPVVLTKKPMAHAIRSSFGDAWKERVSEVTVKMWGSCFQSMAWEHKDRGNFVKLNLKVEHYYNVVVSPLEEEAFSKKNPFLTKVTCDKQCLIKVSLEMGYDKHCHFVHGAYAGSRVDGVDCAPPFRLSKFWENEIFLDHVRVDKALRAPHASDASPEGGVPAVPSRKIFWDDGRGTKLLKELVERKDEVGLLFLRKMYQNPHAAEWATQLPEDNEQKAELLQRRDELCRMAFMLGKEGKSLSHILTRLWRADRTEEKVAASYAIREHVLSDHVWGFHFGE